MNGIILSTNLLQIFNFDLINHLMKTLSTQPAMQRVRKLVKQTFFYKLASAACY